MSNEFKNPEPKPEPFAEQKPKETKKVRSFLRFFSIRSIFNRENVMSSLSFVFFLATLAIIYIANSYNAEKEARKIETTQKELKELVSEYGSIKRMMQDSSRQTIVARKVESMGLYEATLASQKQIVVNRNELVAK
jgi:cell division protein FtsL